MVDHRHHESDGKPPLRERFDWPSVAIFVIFLGTFVYALLQR